MAKYNNTAPKKYDTKTYPSTFGSHESMLSDKYKEFNNSGADCVICEDDQGCYVTDRKILDSEFCDYKRCGNIPKRIKTFEKFVELHNL